MYASDRLGRYTAPTAAVQHTVIKKIIILFQRHISWNGDDIDRFCKCLFKA